MTNRKNRDGASIREDRPCGCPEKYFAYIVTVCLEPFNPSGLYKNTGDKIELDVFLHL